MCEIEELAHTAEIGLRARAATPAELFACLARATFALVGTEPDETVPAVETAVTIRAPDAESLLVDWLGELLYLYETTGRIAAECTVEQWNPTDLTATVYGRPSRTMPSMHIKAVTYHDLVVGREGDGWVGQVVFDV